MNDWSPSEALKRLWIEFLRRKMEDGVSPAEAAIKFREIVERQISADAVTGHEDAPLEPLKTLSKT